MADITELYPELNYFDNAHKQYINIDKKATNKDFIATCEERKDYDNTEEPAKD